MMNSSVFWIQYSNFTDPYLTKNLEMDPVPAFLFTMTEILFFIIIITTAELINMLD